MTVLSQLQETAARYKQTYDKVQQEVDEANEELEDLRAQVDEKDKRIASMATELSRLSNVAVLVRVVC